MSPNRTREGGRRPPFPSPFLPLLPSPSLLLGGNLLQVGLPLPFLVQEGGGRKEWERKKARGARPPFLVLFGLKGRGRASCPGRPLSLSTRAQQGPLVPGGGGLPVTLRHSDFLRNHPEHFQCPNIVVQYINLYVSTISRLLVMSVIIPGTPTTFGTSKLINL